jgi:hypothetical protein
MPLPGNRFIDPSTLVRLALLLPTASGCRLRQDSK